MKVKPLDCSRSSDSSISLSKIRPSKSVRKRKSGLSENKTKSEVKCTNKTDTKRKHFSDNCTKTVSGCLGSKKLINDPLHKHNFEHLKNMLDTCHSYNKDISEVDSTFSYSDICNDYFSSKNETVEDGKTNSVENILMSSNNCDKDEIGSGFNCPNFFNGYINKKNELLKSEEETDQNSNGKIASYGSMEEEPVLNGLCTEKVFNHTDICNSLNNMIHPLQKNDTTHFTEEISTFNSNNKRYIDRGGSGENENGSLGFDSLDDESNSIEDEEDKNRLQDLLEDVLYRKQKEFFRLPEVRDMLQNISDEQAQ